MITVTYPDGTEVEMHCHCDQTWADHGVLASMAPDSIAIECPTCHCYPWVNPGEPGYDEETV